MGNFTFTRTPIIAVDLILELANDEICLVQRSTPPIGWALPGGFVDHGESLWQAAERVAKVDSLLSIELGEQFYTYSDPKRDYRCHVITTVFLCRVVGELPGRRANEIRAFDIEKLPDLPFDHQQIIDDVIHYRRTGQRPRAVRRSTCAEQQFLRKVGNDG